MSHELLTEEEWNAFFNRLEGPEGCDFREKVKGNPDSITWHCKGGMDKSFATTILTDMGVPSETVKDVLLYVEDFGGHCDCEILFNAVERVYAEIDGAAA